MIARAYGLFLTTAFGASLVLWLSSCAQLGMQGADGTAVGAEQGSSAARAKQHRIVQVLIDGRPTYAICVEPSCPVVTPKILAADVAEAGDQGHATAEAESQGEGQPVAKPEADRHEGVPTEMPLRQTAVNFSVNSAVLSEQAKRDLDRAMPWARRADRIVISGRTDNQGSEPLNQRLAFARALAVREYIRDQIPLVNNVISIDARGACCFVASNATSQGRTRNRRVEIVFRGLHMQEAS